MQPFWSRHADLVLRVGQDASYLADVSAARQNARELAAETLDIVVEARLWLIAVVRPRRGPDATLARGVGHHPHGEVLRPTAVGMAKSGARPGDLVGAGLAHDLERGLGEAQQAGRPDGVGAEHPA